MYTSTNVEPVLVANAVLRVAFHEEVHITAARLQCVLFDLELLHRRRTGLPLIGAHFTTAPFGPRVSTIDAQYGLPPWSATWNDPTIDRFGENAQERAYSHYDLAVTGEVYLCLAAAEQLTVREHIERLRAEGTPWRTAFEKNQHFLDEDRSEEH